MEAREERYRQEAEQRQKQLEEQLRASQQLQMQLQTQMQQQQQMMNWFANQTLLTSPPGTVPTPPFAFPWVSG